jgi:D-alanine-D-alanine ligase
LGDRALPPCEIKTKREFYNYEAKYVDDDTQYIFDIDLPPQVLADLQSLSLQAHSSIGCEVISRVDWIVEEATLRPFLLEINTLPGFTSHSLVPKAAQRVGLSFESLCEEIIELSLTRFSRQTGAMP